ncbi:MAG: ferrous iron transport protein B [Planctomycetaceae bacterium]|nr:ferrous iron transport protein B [Planctomycetaceae bacterium]
MSVATRPITVALIGNPNTGKSTLFNALSGLRQRVGNYPGVTVEKKIGRTEFHGRQFTVVDLPGTYSLAPRSPDEMVAVDVLLGRRNDVEPIDVVLCIVDASNLERNLYLVSQVLELGLPTVVALNMTDVAEGKGLALDVDRLRKQLPVRIVPVQANRGTGLAELKKQLAAAAESPVPSVPSPFPEAFQQEVEQLGRRSSSNGHVDPKTPLPRYLLERLLLDTSGYLASSGLDTIDEPLLGEVRDARSRLANAGLPVPAIEAIARYQWAGSVLTGVVTRPAQRKATLTDRIDRVLTHRVWGALVFLCVMLLLFLAVYYVPDITRASATIDWLMELASAGVVRVVPEGALRSLLITGIVGGVGGVVVFLPQIFTLFFFIAVLEDCGYMARAAYLMDKLMSRIGLSGKSFIPLLSSFACAVPAIMATRVIENRRDRLVTILVAPLMSCSARLPVYTLLIAAFIPNLTIGSGWFAVPWLHALTLFAMYALTIVAGVAAAWVFKKTLFRGPTPPFVMELPSYKLPGLGVVLHRMFEQGWAFVYRAGTLILAVSILVWALAYYPRDATRIDAALLVRQAELQQQLDATPAADRDSLPAAVQLAAIDNHIAAAHLENSYLGRMGKAIEPAVRPLGWDWRIGCAAIASFPAREVVVATLGVIYNLGEGQDEGSDALQDTLRAATWAGTDRPVFNVPVALSIMVFFALCAQCASTLAVMRRETGTWRWPALTFVYMTTLAYVAALVTYQVGMWIGS